MNIISLQILLINFLVSSVLTGILYFFCRPVRNCNPLLIFVISSIGTSFGSIIGQMIPALTINTEFIILNNFIHTIPGIFISLLFLLIWVSGSKTEGYV